jgi:hypothetical protein
MNDIRKWNVGYALLFRTLGGHETDEVNRMNDNGDNGFTTFIDL